MRAAQLPDDLEMLLHEENLVVRRCALSIEDSPFDRIYLQNAAPTLRVCISGSKHQISSFAEVSEEALLLAIEASMKIMKSRAIKLHQRVKIAMRAKAQLQEDIDKCPGKFSIRTMATGSIDDFHKGLQDRIGEPCLYISPKCVSFRRQGHRIWIFSKPCAQSTRQWAVATLLL